MEGEAIIMKGARVVCGLAGNRHTLVERAALHVRVNEAQLWTVAAAAESVRHQGAEHAESNRVGGGLWLGGQATPRPLAGMLHTAARDLQLHDVRVGER